MLTLKKVKELVEAPSHAKRTPSPKMLFEEGIVLLRREFDQGSHLTIYNSGYVLFSAGKRNTVFHIHDCCGDYAYDAAVGKGDVIKEEYFENCEWHMNFTDNPFERMMRQRPGTDSGHPCKHCRHKWECGYLLHQCRKKFRSVLGDTAPPAAGAVRP